MKLGLTVTALPPPVAVPDALAVHVTVKWSLSTRVALSQPDGVIPPTAVAPDNNTHDSNTPLMAPVVAPHPAQVTVTTAEPDVTDSGFVPSVVVGCTSPVANSTSLPTTPPGV